MSEDDVSAPAQADVEGSELLPLRVAVSTRALFDLEAEHLVFETEGVEAYVRALREREASQMEKGACFGAVSRLLGLNAMGSPPLVEVVILSRNAPEVSLRTFASIAHHGLEIATGSFTGGGAIAPLLEAWKIDLFLSRDAGDVEAAHSLGIAAAKFGGSPEHAATPEPNELRIAFDGDAVVFSDEAEQIFARKGLRAFLRHEEKYAQKPMPAGPFERVLRKVAALREARRNSPRATQIRTALVTARTAPAHARAINTLRAWGIELDEAHFVGEADKGRVLAAFGAHIFFDDQERNIIAARSYVPAGHVPGRGGFRKVGS